jgi:NAD+ kinase
MNIAFFGRHIAPNDLPYFQKLLDALDPFYSKVRVYRHFFKSLEGKISFGKETVLFEDRSELVGQTDFLFSIGGDGTILESAGIVGDSGIPVIGINLGRLGFLSSIPREFIIPAIKAIVSGEYIIEKRSLLQLTKPDQLFGPVNYALNELTVYKPNVMTLLTIRTWINGVFLNTYWADGLIVATPTGSTAYSMSCTGPIITPDAENFLITPIASHNLTVRPIVVRDDSEIKISVACQDADFNVSLDSRLTRLPQGAELVVRKAPFRLNLVRLTGTHFFQTIREKLNWGLDIRNDREKS